MRGIIVTDGARRAAAVSGRRHRYADFWAHVFDAIRAEIAANPTPSGAFPTSAVLRRREKNSLFNRARFVGRMKRTLIFLLALLTLPLAAEPEYPKMGPDIYDTKADGTAQIAAALAKATAEKKHVILMFGANWCIWCHRLHATFAADATVAKALRQDFEVVLIDVNTDKGQKRNAAVNERYGNPIAHGLPVLVVLDSRGRPLTTKDTGELESGERHDPAKILAFLAAWKPKG